MTSGQQDFLDDGNAEATAIRRELAKLRQILDDVEHAPPPPPRRRVLWPLLAVAATVAVVGVLAAFVSQTVIGGTGEAGAATSPTPTPSVSAGPNSPAGAQPAGGPGISQPGTFAGLSIVDGTEIEVHESMILGAHIDSLVLNPLPEGRLAPELVGVRPEVRDLQITVDGGAAQAVPDATDGTWTLATPASKKGSRIELRYRIIGAVVRSTPSVNGRVLAAFTPLTGRESLAAGTPVLEQAGTDLVMGMVCAGAPYEEQLCASQTATTWTAVVPTGTMSPTITIQADLNTPG